MVLSECLIRKQTSESELSEDSMFSNDFGARRVLRKDDVTHQDRKENEVKERDNFSVLFGLFPEIV